MEGQQLLVDLDKSRSAMSRIRGLDGATATIEEIKEFLSSVLGGYAVTVPRFFPGLRLFRARICEKPTNIRELMYPPAHLASQGRANRAGCPMLYCCLAREAPFFESRPPVGSPIVIARWVTTENLIVNHVGYTREAFDQLGSIRTITGWGNEPVEASFGEPDLEIHRFISDAFTRPVSADMIHLYKLPIAIAERLCSDDLFGGLLYPAVAMKGNADNIALKPSFADHNLKFVKAEFATITGFTDFRYEIQLHDSATQVGEDGTIHWKNRLDQWILRNQGDELTFTALNGEWEARDSDGKVVEPS